FNSEPKTNAQGYFSGLFAANETAKWLAQYNGDKTHFGCRTARVKVTVSGGSDERRYLTGVMRAWRLVS
ncbi:MAG: hypothetical protein ACRDRJ_40980, partial [Streptosporangiaceae bacterium]